MPCIYGCLFILTAEGTGQRGEAALKLWNASKIAASLGVTPPAVRHYLDILQDFSLVRQLQPYHPNLRKRCVKSPKVYVRDSGLLHGLLGLGSLDDLLGHPVAGPSWAGWVIEQIVAATPRGRKPWFYRTGTGAEIDLILAQAALDRLPRRGGS